MAAASYHPRILIPKYEQTDNVKPLTANRGLQFAVGWPNLDLKVSTIYIAPLIAKERAKRNEITLRNTTVHQYPDLARP